MRAIVVFLMFTLSSTCLYATIINVPDDFEKIQAAIDDDGTTDGDTVLVAEGRYIEGIRLEEKQLTVASCFLTTGERRYIDRTIIDADHSSTVVTFTVDHGSNLTGFTIQNGFNEFGGGIHCDESSPTISGCIIRNSHADYGAGIYCDESHPEISDCEIYENISDRDGAGIWCEDSSPLIYGCEINLNEASGNGGGLCIFSVSSPTVENCVLEENVSQARGGGIYVTEECYPTIISSKLLDNVSSDYGGGLCIENSSEIHLRYCLLEDNESQLVGGQIAALEAATTVVVNCTFDWETDPHTAIYCRASSVMVVNSNLYGQMPLRMEFSAEGDPSEMMIAFSNVHGGEATIETNDNGEVYWDAGNIDADPLFFFDPSELEYHLQEDSPCVDAGTAFFVWDEDTLVNLSEGEYNGNAPDIGAYESEYVGAVNGDFHLPAEFVLFQNYPNPFNAVTTITYGLPFASLVSLQLYDLSVREVRTLVEGNRQAGIHHTALSAGSLPSGVYLCRLEANGEKRSMKLALIR